MRWSSLALWVLAVLLGACAHPVKSPTRAEGLRNAGHRHSAADLKPCGPEEREREMLCGSLRVAEDPDEPNGRSINLRIVVLAAVGEKTTQSALFHLAGGPGLAASQAASFYFTDPVGRAFRSGRDVVLLDQRGTGESNALHCPSTEDNGPLEEMYRVAEVDACRAELEGQADLTKYGTWYAAGDLDRVRRALDYEQVDFWALSYGTKLAQVYMKRFPERVRTAFLVGTIELDNRTPLYHAAAAQRVLDLLFVDCQTDASCRRTYPDLRNDWKRVLARLEDGPVEAHRLNPENGEKMIVEIRRGPFGHAFGGLLGTAASQRRVPWLIHRMAAGDFDGFVEALSFGTSPYAEGLYLSIACSEGTSRIHSEDVSAATSGTFLGAWRVRQQIEACSRWPQATLPREFFEPATTEAAVIVLSGGRDTANPLLGRRVCDGLPRCRFLTVPHLGHTYFDVGEWTGGECPDRIALDLYRKADVEAVDASCLKAMEPPRFFVE